MSDINYHISWLKKALENCSSNTVNENTTIGEFIRRNCENELKDIIEIDD